MWLVQHVIKGFQVIRNIWNYTEGVNIELLLYLFRTQQASLQKLKYQHQSHAEHESHHRDDDQLIFFVRVGR